MSKPISDLARREAPTTGRSQHRLDGAGLNASTQKLRHREGLVDQFNQNLWIERLPQKIESAGRTGSSHDVGDLGPRQKDHGHFLHAAAAAQLFSELQTAGAPQVDI